MRRYSWLRLAIVFGVSSHSVRHSPYFPQLFGTVRWSRRWKDRWYQRPCASWTDILHHSLCVTYSLCHFLAISLNKFPAIGSIRIDNGQPLKRAKLWTRKYLASVCLASDLTFQFVETLCTSISGYFSSHCVVECLVCVSECANQHFHLMLYIFHWLFYSHRTTGTWLFTVILLRPFFGQSCWPGSSEKR